MATVGRQDIPYRGGGGPPRALTSEQERQVIALYVDTRVPVVQIAQTYQICKKTVYNILNKHRAIAAKQEKAPTSDQAGG